MTLFDGPDCRLNVERSGSGPPVTLFAHGITGSIDELVPLGARTQGTRVFMDFRGHGASESPPVDAGYDHPAMRRDLSWVADRFDATQVVALSMGAGALMNLLADAPDRFEKIVLVTPASIDGPNLGAGELFLDLAAHLERGEDITQWSLDGAAEIIARAPQWEGLIRERVARMNRIGVPRALRAYVHGRAPVEDAEALRAVRAPVLILAHDGDPIHDIGVAERLSGLLPNARLVTWGRPLEMLDEPDATAAMIAEFFATA